MWCTYAKRSVDDMIGYDVSQSRLTGHMMWIS